ncbi:septal ring lytic transglycosylase RlpA family protein [Nitrosomonas sp. JL21]|nr:septal ring lytic transglycosylase RlpA family protein [Nitrosomonas sp. JL21]
MVVADYFKAGSRLSIFLNIRIADFDSITTTGNLIKIMNHSLIFCACLIVISGCAAIEQPHDTSGKTPPTLESADNPTPAEPIPIVKSAPSSASIQKAKPLGSPPSLSQTADNSTPDPSWPTETGYATYYAAEMEGRLTASGEPYDAGQLTAAHKTIPIGSLVRITNPKTKRQVVVRINDRWGGGGDRIINLSKHAAEQLEFGKSGLVFVHVDVESVPAKSVTASTGPRPAPLPERIEETESVNHSKLSICQNEADILGLTGEFFRNHVAGCLARGK